MIADAQKQTRETKRGVLCPHCHKRFSGYKKQRDYLNLELGRCVDCECDKTDEEVARGNWRCAKCRAKRAAKMAKKRIGSAADVMTSHVYRPRANWR